MPQLEVESHDAPRPPSAERQERAAQLYRALARNWENVRALAEHLDWPTWTVYDTLLHVRSHPEFYRWTVPHAPRGMMGGRYPSRFVRVLLDSNDEPYHTVTEAQQVNDGLIATLRHGRSSKLHEADALDADAAYRRNPAERRAVREMAYDLRYQARKAEQLIELIEANGA